MSNHARQRYLMYSPSLDLMMKEVARTLGHIDFEHQVELEKVEKSASAKELKQYIRENSGSPTARGVSPMSTC